MSARTIQFQQPDQQAVERQRYLENIFAHCLNGLALDIAAINVAKPGAVGDEARLIDDMLAAVVECRARLDALHNQFRVGQLPQTNTQPGGGR